MSTPIEESITVELGDTDMARFIHYSSVVRYFDVGIRTVLEAADLSFRDLFDRGLGLPVVAISCEYTNPMYYGDELTIRTTVDELGNTTVTLAFEFVNQHGDETAVGSLTMAVFDIEERRATSIPDDVRQHLAAVGTER